MKLWQNIISVLVVLVATVTPFVAVNAQTDEWGGDAWGEGWSDDWSDSDAASESESTDDTFLSNWALSGFVDGAYGVFAVDNPVESEQSLAEIRSHFSAQKYFGNAFFSAKLELVADDVDSELRLEARDFYLDFPFAEKWNLKIGQQVLTWGTGDFVFLNDFFPKDWQAMFSGRDDDYLKAASASVKLSYFADLANLDVVVTPDFTPDNYITGERFSYFNPVAGDIVAAPPKIRTEQPGSALEHAQYFSRLFKTVNGVEYAAYFYRGYYTQPLGFNPLTAKNTFPRLNSYGFSFRTPWQGGIANMEWSWWYSRDDKDGDDPLIPNSTVQWLSGFEKEVFRNFTAASQLLLTYTQDYDEQQHTSPNPEYSRDEFHSLLTLRLTYMALQEKLTQSLFVFYSPADNDYFIKPKISYRYSDQWMFTVGANLFGGQDAYSQWGQFTENDNVYLKLKYSF